MSMTKQMRDLVQLALVAVFGFGIAFYIASTLITALGATTTGGMAVNSILGAFSTAITNVFVPIVSVLFVLLLYSIAKQHGLFGGKKGE